MPHEYPVSGRQRTEVELRIQPLDAANVAAEHLAQSVATGLARTQRLPQFVDLTSRDDWRAVLVERPRLIVRVQAREDRRDPLPREVLGERVLVDRGLDVLAVRC